ncbi:vitamin K epoxide reductase family protein [Euhalothece natronophila Z-M001]|uniref:Vitamin K epoxide reductase family protein n=1 Tax=Euhalothece natronophila Z-M001 TaxID=522448 RepID=A0A5B8NLN3_9CHRO|nr:vitamin K epoxide reductase family protein [Euhalothece natronophila]QDZ39847.1 vitamin K epoxide reductase family protein [Euhalothece natronophila Z-M001]
MTRRRSTPWIQRWSRPIIGAIAVLGAVLTAYLTVQSFTGQPVGCAPGAEPASGACSNVLTSEYATVFGLPLSLFGFLAYSAMTVFALTPLVINRDTNKKLRNQIEEWSWLFLLIGSTAMTVFSGYLMYILATELQQSCPYCIGSAIFSISLLSLTLLGKEWDDLGQVLFIGAIVILVTFVGTLGVYADVNTGGASAEESNVIPVADSSPQPPDGWETTTTSGDAEIALAEHLTEIGAKNYGAFWCPHCYEQKQLFGETAFDKINYIECDPRGRDPQPETCQEAGVESYPSWEINGEMYRGTQTLEELAELSDYEGSTDFKYELPSR